jgi:hypothetical protein
MKILLNVLLFLLASICAINAQSVTVKKIEENKSLYHSSQEALYEILKDNLTYGWDIEAKVDKKIYLSLESSEGKIIGYSILNDQHNEFDTFINKIVSELLTDLLFVLEDNSLVSGEIILPIWFRDKSSDVSKEEQTIDLNGLVLREVVLQRYPLKEVKPSTIER